MPATRLRHVAFSHVEADECGALNDWLAVAPHAAPLCGKIAAIVSVADLADSRPLALADGEARSLGRHTVRWIDAPHLPHGWECGFLMEESTDGHDVVRRPVHATRSRPARADDTDILGPREAFRGAMDYFSHSKNAGDLLEKLARHNPTTLACMHGSAWRGDGAALLRALAGELAR